MQEQNHEYQLGVFRQFRARINIATSHDSLSQRATQPQPQSQARPGPAAAPAPVPAPVDRGLAKWASAVTPLKAKRPRVAAEQRSASTVPASDHASAAPQDSGTSFPTRPITLSLQLSSGSDSGSSGAEERGWLSDSGSSPMLSPTPSPHAAAAAAAAAALPRKLTFTVADLGRLHTLLRLLCSLRPRDSAYLQPAAVILKALERDIELHPSRADSDDDEDDDGEEEAVPLVRGDAFYAAMHYVLSATEAAAELDSRSHPGCSASESIDHLVACCFVAFQAPVPAPAPVHVSGPAAPARQRALVVPDFLLAVTAWTSRGWGAAFRLVDSADQGRIDQSQLRHLFSCCVRLLLATHSGLQRALSGPQFALLVSSLAAGSAQAFFPVADPHGRGSISFADFTRVRRRYPTLVPFLAVMSEAKKRALAGTVSPSPVHSEAEVQKDRGMAEAEAEAQGEGDELEEWARIRAAAASLQGGPSASAAAADAGADAQDSDADPAPVLSVALQPSLPEHVARTLPRSGAGLAAAYGSATLHLYASDIHNFSFLRSLAAEGCRGADAALAARHVVREVCAAEAQEELLAQRQARTKGGEEVSGPVSLSVSFGRARVDALFARLLPGRHLAPSYAPLRAALLDRVFLVLSDPDESGVARVSPTRLALALLALLPRSNEENLRSAWQFLAARGADGRLDAASLAELLAGSLRVLLMLTPDSFAHSPATGSAALQPGVRALVDALSRAACADLLALAGAPGRARARGLSYAEFARLYAEHPTLLPWIEVLDGLVQGEAIVRQQQQQQQQEQGAAADGEAYEYEEQQRAQGYRALDDSDGGSDGDGDGGSDAASSPRLTPREAALLREAIAAASSPDASSSEAEEDGGSRQAWTVRVTPQPPSQLQQRQQAQLEALRILQQKTGGQQKLAKQPVANTNANTNGATQDRSESPLRTALSAAARSSRRSSSSSSSSGASFSRRSSVSSAGSDASARRRQRRAQKRVGPHTLSLDPFSVSLRMHQDPSPRAVASAVKVKPLPVFTLPSHAPKLLLCIPLHQDQDQDQDGSGSANGAGSGSGTGTPSYGSGKGSVHSLKVYDQDLRAFVFFKSRLARTTAQALLDRFARYAASSRGSRGAAATTSPFETRLNRMEFASCLRELMQDDNASSSASAAPSPRASASSSSSSLAAAPSNQEEQQLHGYAVSLFRMLDHDSRGAVLLGEVVLTLSLFLPASSEDKLRVAFRVLVQGGSAGGVGASGGGGRATIGVAEVASFYLAVYSALSALCSTSFRMSVPSRPGSPSASARGPLSPSSAHALPHEQLQSRLACTSRVQGAHLIRLASEADSAADARGRIDEEAFLGVTTRHRHLLSFLNCIDLDPQIFSPKSGEEAAAAAAAAAATEAKARADGQAREQQAAFQAALRDASASASSARPSRRATAGAAAATASPSDSDDAEEIVVPDTQGRATALLLQQQCAASNRPALQLSALGGGGAGAPMGSPTSFPGDGGADFAFEFSFGPIGGSGASSAAPAPAWAPSPRLVGVETNPGPGGVVASTNAGAEQPGAGSAEGDEPPDIHSRPDARSAPPAAPAPASAWVPPPRLVCVELNPGPGANRSSVWVFCRLVLLWLLLVGSACYTAYSGWYAQPFLSCLAAGVVAPVTLALLAAAAPHLCPGGSDSSDGGDGAGAGELAVAVSVAVGDSSPTDPADMASPSEGLQLLASVLGVEMDAEADGQMGPLSSPDGSPMTIHRASLAASAFSTKRRCCPHWRRWLLVASLSVLSYCALSFALLHRRGLWCAYPAAWHVELCEQLAEVSAVLTSHGVKHWMARGDLIALEREGDLFPWEHDLDLCVLDSQMDFAKAVLLERSATRANFSVHPLSAVLPGSPVLYMPLNSLRQSNPLFALRHADDVFALRDGEPIVVDIFPCSDRFEEVQHFRTELQPYCMRGHPLPFPEAAVRRRMLDKWYPGWTQRQFQHHAPFCNLHVDRYEWW